MAREEGEQIQSDMEKMIAEYQTSKEIRSNSLDIQLRKTEEELCQQEQKIVDQHQIHQLTVKDLDITRASLEISQKECQQLKTRVSVYWKKQCGYRMAPAPIISEVFIDCFFTKWFKFFSKVWLC